jgi:hypothetical protein
MREHAIGIETRIDQNYDSMREEPRFQALVTKIFAPNR